MICQGCNGVVGRDCFNPSECVQITQAMAQDSIGQGAAIAALEWRIGSLETINGHMLTACKWALAALCSHGPCKNNGCGDCKMARAKLREVIDKAEESAKLGAGQNLEEESTK